MHAWWRPICWLLLTICVGLSAWIVVYENSKWARIWRQIFELSTGTLLQVCHKRYIIAGGKGKLPELYQTYSIGSHFQSALIFSEDRFSARSCTNQFVDIRIIKQFQRFLFPRSPHCPYSVPLLPTNPKDSCRCYEVFGGVTIVCRLFFITGGYIKIVSGYFSFMSKLKLFAGHAISLSKLLAFYSLKNRSEKFNY